MEAESNESPKTFVSTIKLKSEDEKLLVSVLKRGRERGFITYNEILQIFPTIEKKVEVLEELYRRLEFEDIDLVAQQELLELKAAEKETKRKKKVFADLDA